ncbi:MAG: putative Serine:threonine protein kinase PLK4, partial [Streblomastix strix]
PKPKPQHPSSSIQPQIHQIPIIQVQPISNPVKPPIQPPAITQQFNPQFLAQIPPDQQNQYIGEFLYAKISTIDEPDAGKITGMLLELDIVELINLLKDDQLLNRKTCEAQRVLREAATQQQPISFNTTWKKSDFERIGRLGRGAFGTIWHMKEKASSREVAVKEMDYYTQEENEDGDKAYLVLEYCSKGDLRKYINNMKELGVEISTEKAYEMIGQIASSLDQLHAIDIIHADLKPENVLLVEGFKVKLADFGLARQLQIGRNYTTKHGGTFLYQGPELLRIKKIEVVVTRLIQTPASDIWAFGVMIFELLTQRHPFFDNRV